MPTFGKTSESRLIGVYPRLVTWAHRVVEIMDCTVIYGVRTLEQQKELFLSGASRTLDSYHLVQEDGFGHAIDLAPYPINWKNYDQWWLLIGVGLAVAHDMNLPIVNGRDWDGDMDFDDQKFNDFAHWQTNEGIRR